MSRDKEISQEQEGIGERCDSRRTMLGGLGVAAVAVPLGIAAFASDPPTALAATAAPSFYLSANGIYDDGATDYTSQINALYTAAATYGGTVVWDITYGLGYKVSGIVVQPGTRTIGWGCNLDRTNAKLEGVVLFPASTSISNNALMYVGGSSTPNGTTIQGLGFYGMTGYGTSNQSNVSGLSGVMASGGQDISVLQCVALNIDKNPNGGGAFFWNGSPNGRCYQCAAYDCGYGIKADGAGATDGRVDEFQANACVVSISLGQNGTSTGGDVWSIGPGVHLEGGGLTNYHLLGGSNLTTTRCTGVYFGAGGGPQISYAGIGLQVTNCEFDPQAETSPIVLSTTTAKGPDSSIVGNRLNVGSNSILAFVQVGTSGNPYSLIFDGNTATAGGGTGPSNFHYVVNASGAQLTGSTNGTATFTSANQIAW